MFKFRLQRVLELREKHQEEVATRLTAARIGEERARAQCAMLEDARDVGVERAAALNGSAPTVGQLQNLRYVVERLNVEIEQAHHVADAAGRAVRTCLSEFTEAFRDRRVLDRLRDRAHETWAAEEAHGDLKVMDSVAITGYIRAHAPKRETEG